jgi:alkyl hydroperoxide reductase subunit AhpC
LDQLRICNGKKSLGTDAAVRNVYVIGPDKTIKLLPVYPMRIGRNFNEVVRVIDALHPTARHEFVTPANWKGGDDVMNAGSVSDEDAKRQYPRGW